MWFIRKYRVLFIFLLTCEITYGQKTDKVYLVNGNMLTGEIKSMSLAKLRFDLDGPGIIEIKWEKVTAFRSNRDFEITLRSGEILIGKPDSAFFKSYNLVTDDIVEMATIKKRFVKRLYGNFDIGFNYTKSSKIIQFNFNGTLGYRIPKLEVELQNSSFFTRQMKDSSSTTREQDLALSGIRYFDHRVFTGASIKLQQNTELGIANRYLFNGLLGKDFLRNNHNRFLGAGGFSFSEEQSFESSVYTANFDALISIQYKLFYYSAPKRSIDLSFNTYPGIADWGRIRIDMELNTSIEVFKDFLVGINVYDKFDNKPPEGATSKNDYGVTFTIGYKFNK